MVTWPSETRFIFRNKKYIGSSPDAMKKQSFNK